MANGELVPQSELAKSSTGSYTITQKDLEEMDMLDVQLLALAMEKLVQANPKVEFTVEDDVFSGGIRVSWKAI